MLFEEVVDWHNSRTAGVEGCCEPEPGALGACIDRGGVPVSAAIPIATC